MFQKLILKLVRDTSFDFRPFVIAMFQKLIMKLVRDTSFDFRLL